MKIASTHKVTLSPGELAERLGFKGAATVVEEDEHNDYEITIEGDALPATPKLTLPNHGPGVRSIEPAPAPALVASAEGRRTVTVEFETTGDFVALVAYADELKREIEMMLARVPEPGVTATVTVR